MTIKQASETARRENIVRLALVNKQLTLWLELTALVYGNPELRETDTYLYLDGIKNSMLPCDKAIETRLRQLRSTLDRALSDDDSLLALELANKL